MKYYHGSPIGGLTELLPFLSEHQDLRQTMEKYNLTEKPDDEMSMFIKEHFREIWVE